MVRVQLLYFDGCPNAMKAQEDLNAVLSEEGFNAQIERIVVRNPSHARRLRFLGSPTIRINGRDVESDARSRTNYGFMCRTYRTAEGVTGTPSRAQIMETIRCIADAE